MPFINVIVSGRPDAELSATIAGAITRLTAQHLGKDPVVTAVAVSYVEPEHWFAGGRSIAAAGTASYWLDIKITEATNTKDEIETYIATVFAEMDKLLGGVHEESYALVDAVPAAAYGYGGKTQEHRFVAGRLARAA